MKRVVIAALLFSALATSVPAQSRLTVDVTSVDISQFPLVTLRMQIRRQGVNPVSLQALSGFVTENGIPQNVLSLSCPQDSGIRLSVAVLLDKSGSMARYPDDPDRLDPDSTKMRAAKVAIRTFLNLLSPRDEAAIFGFTTSGSFSQRHIFTVEHDFSNDIESLKRSLVPVVAVGGTSIWQAIIDAVDLLKLRAGKKILIIVTDGRNQIGNQFRNTALQNAVNEGIPVYSIGIGGDVDEAELGALSSATGGRFFNSPDAAGLGAIFSLIAEEILNDECVLRYEASNVCPDGSRRDVDVQLTGPAIVAEDETSYDAPYGLSTVNLEFDLPAVLPSRDTLRAAVFTREMFSTTMPISATIRIRFDAALLRWVGVEQQGSMTEGRVVSAREESPGQLLVELNNVVPTLPSGPLFYLVFDSFAADSTFDTGLAFVQGAMTALCPYRVLMLNKDFTILPCAEQYTFGIAEPLVVGLDGKVELPLHAVPKIPSGAKVELRGTLSFDASQLEYEGIRLAPAMQGGSALVTGNAGVMDVLVDGTPTDSLSSLATVRFTVRPRKEVTKLTVQFQPTELDTRCRTSTDFVPYPIIVDGICQPLLRRVASQAISSFPNPAPHAATVQFTVTQDGPVIVRLLDASGRELRRLLDAWMPSGSYTQSVDTSQLPSGDYLAVLESGATATVARIVVMR